MRAAPRRFGGDPTKGRGAYRNPEAPTNRTVESENFDRVDSAM